MEYKKVVFTIEDGSASYRKWKENKVGCKKENPVIKEGPMDRSKKNRENAKQFQEIFEPFLNEILAQFPQHSAKQ